MGRSGQNKVLGDAGRGKREDDLTVIVKGDGGQEKCAGMQARSEDLRSGSQAPWL